MSNHPILDQQGNPEFHASAISCTGCAWRHADGVTCDAFPDGIPAPILLGVYDHSYPYQVGEDDDGGLTRTDLADL